MASVTLAESAKLSQNMLVRGVIESVVTVDKLFDMLPFLPIEGNALQYNRENALGDVQVATVGDTITAKAAATFSQVTSSLTTIIGDAEVNGLVQATRSNFTDQEAAQIASKAKSAGRQYSDMLVNGTGLSNQFEGLLALATGSQLITQDTAGVDTDGGSLSFEKLDALIDLVLSKDGEVDFLTMHSKIIRRIMQLYRAQGGASIVETATLPSGRQVPTYRGIPLFRNDWIPINQTRGASTDCTTVLAGVFDDGSEKIGVAGLTARESAGIVVEPVGVHQSKDERITRVKWYCGLACFSTLGLAGLRGVKTSGIA